MSGPYNNPTAPPNFDHIICLWDIGWGIPCCACIHVSDLSKHLRMHGVKGPAKLVMPCAWNNCGRAHMKRESIVRHVEEVHLQVKYVCNECGASFSRRSTRNGHVSKLHAS